MTRAWNWRLWMGFLLVFAGPFVFFSLFEKTGAAFSIGILLILAGTLLLVGGLRNAYSAPQAYGGKVAGPILAVLAVLVIAAFGYGKYMMGQAYSKAQNAPRVGDQAPQFVVKDRSGKQVKLADLLAASLPDAARTRGVLLVFYRGYW